MIHAGVATVAYADSRTGVVGFRSWIVSPTDDYSQRSILASHDIH